MNNCILYFWPHFLSVDCRKSRSNLFSMRSLFNSVSIFCLGGVPSFLGRPFGFGSVCKFRIVTCRLLYRLTHHLICCFSRPSSSAISCRVIPASLIAIIRGSFDLISDHLRLLINSPPCVVIILHMGVFCLLSSFTGSVQKRRVLLFDFSLWPGRR